MAAQATNLTVTPPWQLSGGGTPYAVQVFICDVCGVLQINPPGVLMAGGGYFTPMPHQHE